SLEIGLCHLHHPKFDAWGRGELLQYIKIGTDDRIYAMAQLLRLGCKAEDLARATGIDAFFIRKLQNIVEMEQKLRNKKGSISALYEAKKMGFSDRFLARL